MYLLPPFSGEAELAGVVAPRGYVPVDGPDRVVNLCVYIGLRSILVESARGSRLRWRFGADGEVNQRISSFRRQFHPTG